MDGRLSPAQTTAKVNFKIQSHYLHFIGGNVNPRDTLEGSLRLPLPILHFEYPVRELLAMPTQIQSTEKRPKDKWTISLVL